MDEKKTNGELTKAESAGALVRLQCQEEILRELKKEKNKSRYYFELMQAFEGYIAGGSGTDVITQFLGEVAEMVLREEGIEEKLDANVDLGGLICRCHSLAFAVGYIFGQEFKICDKEVVPLVEELRQKLIDQGVLSFTSNRK
jgi:hypothetical protein